MKITKAQQIQFLEILEKKKIHPVYQPIVSLSDGSIYGYEALSRIDLPDCKFNTEQMFKIAEKMKCVWELESICRKKSIHNAVSKPKNTKLFINADPKVIHDSKFRSGVTAGYLKKYGMSPNDIVFEITERTSIEDAKTFKRSIEHYTKQNYKIAIDDFGSQYAGPDRLCQLKPHIIKIDIAIIRDIDKDAFKRSFVKSMAVFGKTTDVKILAEGIETREELETLINLGIDYGQGYYLARPQSEFELENSELSEEIIAMNNNLQQRTENSLLKFLEVSPENTPISFSSEGKELGTFTCGQFRDLLLQNNTHIEQF